VAGDQTQNRTRREWSRCDPDGIFLASWSRDPGGAAPTENNTVEQVVAAVVTVARTQLKHPAHIDLSFTRWRS
jgi:hypothetical protein